jgi:hypothetical protein
MLALNNCEWESCQAALLPILVLSCKHQCGVCGLPHTQIKHGETFVSETDTEVIPKLCKFVHSQLRENVPFPQVSVDACIN